MEGEHFTRFFIMVCGLTFIQFVDELMPCLEKATTEGQEARVMSVLALGTGNALDATDLGLKKNFSLMRAARQVPTYNDIFVEVRCLPSFLSLDLSDTPIHSE